MNHDDREPSESESDHELDDTHYRTHHRTRHRKGLPRPSWRLLQWLSVLGLLGLLHAVAVFWPNEAMAERMQSVLLLAWGGVGAFTVVFALWDLIWIRFWAPAVDMERELPSRFAVGEWNKVTLKAHHNSHKVFELFVSDFLPENADYRSLPATVELIPNQASQFDYWIRPTERGELVLTKLQVLYYSRMRFWLDTLWIEQEDRVKVYPNFLALHHYEIETAIQQLSQSGARKVRPRGQGLEFHQLRHYQAGDSLRQIDWKATSRHRRIISKDYQAEKDQSLLFLLDCGRRMRVRDGDLSHFDHAMKSLLLLAYVALKQGDSVGLLTFGGEERWLPPGKSGNYINRILNTLYDLQAQPVASDYLMVAKQVLAKQRRRSLVVLLSNVRDENLGELVPAIKHLQQHHVVLMANLREESLEQVLNQTPHQFSDALRYAGTVHYFQQRRAVHERFVHDNVMAIDCVPQQLPASLVAHYQMIKQRRLL